MSVMLSMAVRVSGARVTQRADSALRVTSVVKHLGRGISRASATVGKSNSTGSSEVGASVVVGKISWARSSEAGGASDESVRPGGEKKKLGVSVCGGVICSARLQFARDQLFMD